MICSAELDPKNSYGTPGGGSTAAAGSEFCRGLPSHPGLAVSLRNGVLNS